jgi:hypothetical protein
MKEFEISLPKAVYFGNFSLDGNKLLASKLDNNEVELPSAETLDEIFKEWNNIFSPPNTKL